METLQCLFYTGIKIEQNDIFFKLTRNCQILLNKNWIV